MATKTIAVDQNNAVAKPEGRTVKFTIEDEEYIVALPLTAEIDEYFLLQVKQCDGTELITLTGFSDFSEDERAELVCQAVAMFLSTPEGEQRAIELYKQAIESFETSQRG